MIAKLIHSTVLREAYYIFRIFYLFFFAEQQLKLKYTQCFKVFNFIAAEVKCHTTHYLISSTYHFCL